MSANRVTPLAPAPARPRSNATTALTLHPAPVDPNAESYYKIHVTRFVNPSCDDVGTLLGISVFMAVVAAYCALMWYIVLPCGAKSAQDSNHFGMAHSFRPFMIEVGRQIGSLVGNLFDAVRAGILWTVISVWWLNAAYFGLFIIYHLIVCQMVNIGKRINHLCDHEELGVIPRLGLHALFHTILALLFHYTLWTCTIPYPTLWSWINFIKLDHPILQYIVLGSIALSFVLGGCNLTLVELVLLPITIPIRIFKHAARMEQERYERERDGTKAGSDDEENAGADDEEKMKRE
ncbi:hypothetical protein RQP46_008190 [Phenoliferia psychrophenolica]